MLFSFSSSANIINLEDPQKLAEATAATLGDPALLRLEAYRAEVEKNAYQETLRLCQAYRVASGRGLVPGHENSAHNLADSTLAWANLARHGLSLPITTQAIPFTDIAGSKFDYNVSHRVKIWEFDQWFRSVHAMYLVSSDGFVQGAVHCLNTLEHRDIRLFAAAILVADYEAALVGQTAFWTFGASAVFKLIGKAISYIPFPTRYLSHFAKLRMTRAQVAISSAIVVPIAGYYYFDYIQSLRESRDLAAEMIKPESNFHLESKRDARALLIAMASQEFYSEWKGETEDDLPNFTAWARANIDAETLAGAHQDLDEMSKIKSPQEDDLKYQKLLKVILPILDQILAAK